MYEKKSKQKSTCNYFLIYAVVIGVLLALPALAQYDQTPGDQMPGSGGPETSSSNAPEIMEKPNQTPALSSLAPDKSSPQSAGTSITWMASAMDPDNDPIFYMFRLKGSATGGEWQSKTGWSTEAAWRWDTSAADSGDNQIGVWIRDGNHAGTDGFDDQGTADYQIVPISIPEAPPETGQTTASTEQNPAPDQNFNPFGGVQQASEQLTAPTETTAQAEETKPANQPPELQGFDLTPASPQEIGTVIAWTAQAADAESDALQFQLLVDGTPITGWQNEPSGSWDTSNSDVGGHTVEVKVKDGNHNPEGDNSRTASFTLTAPNEKPVITDFSPDKMSPQEAGAIITWTASASDKESDKLLYRFLLNGNPETDWTAKNQ
ncbi:Uncharacterised protein [uncultured archaeon]|nr:Uncharacterised protein [uncultured archaeon]